VPSLTTRGGPRSAIESDDIMTCPIIPDPGGER
jgi:hypothetical protein